MDYIPYNKKLNQRARELRNKSTLSERILWNYLKGRKLGYLFNRQKPLHNYIVDFYCQELKLVIEIDGGIHEYQNEDDNVRQRQLETYGIRFLRFTSSEVEKSPKVVVHTIKEMLKILP